MSILYDVFVWVLKWGMHLLSLFSTKIKKGILGRKQSYETFYSLKGKKIIWIHAASLGEYLQGLPVLEALEKEFPEDQILVTFFSPSGYEVISRKAPSHYHLAYLPFDQKNIWEDLLKDLNVRMFVLVKYDFWYRLLSALGKRNVPVYVISAYFYENQYFFKFYGKWFSRRLKESVSWFFHQTASSAALVKSIGLINSSVAGDTRFDMVKKTAEIPYYNSIIEAFKNEQPLIIFGSSWEQEEKIAELIQLQNQSVKILIAPHELSRVLLLKKQFPNAICYSTQEEITDVTDRQVMILDTIGHLSRVYRYADLAIVGGGFHTKGLHNILEAAVYGIPVIFGDAYRKNPEADALIEAGGGKSFPDEYYAAKFILEALKQPAFLQEMGMYSKIFMQQQPHATEIIIKKILLQQLSAS